MNVSSSSSSSCAFAPFLPSMMTGATAFSRPELILKVTKKRRSLNLVNSNQIILQPQFEFMIIATDYTFLEIKKLKGFNLASL